MEPIMTHMSCHEMVELAPNSFSAIENGPAIKGYAENHGTRVRKVAGCKALLPPILLWATIKYAPIRSNISRTLVGWGSAVGWQEVAGKSNSMSFALFSVLWIHPSAHYF